jgi:hypothetical protein
MRRRRPIPGDKKLNRVLGRRSCERSREAESSYISQPWICIHSPCLKVDTPRAARKTRAQKREVRVHVPLLAVLNVCVGAIAARALRTALAHGIHRVRPGAFLHGALLAFREHTCVSHDSDFFPRAFPQSRAAADQYASLLSTPACFSLSRDCPILRPRAGLTLSSGGHATLRSR